MNIEIKHESIILTKIYLPQHHESEGEIIHQHIKSLVLFTEELPDPSVVGEKHRSVQVFRVDFFSQFMKVTILESLPGIIQVSINVI